MIRLFIQILQRRAGILLIGIPLILADIILKPIFPVFQNLINDWYAFTYYMILFMYGYLCISAGDSFWEFLNRKKFSALVTGFVAFPLLVWAGSAHNSTAVFETLFAVIRIINLGAWCIVIFGYGAVMLNRPSTLLAYCNQAVYPFYIVHQTITILAAFYIYNLQWPVISKFIFLTVVTFGGSLMVFEVVKRIAILRPFFGIKPRI